MVHIEWSDEQVIFHVKGLHVLWACRQTITIPRACLINVETTRDAGLTRPQGMRCIGTYIPGFLIAGTYRCPGGKAFWDVRHVDRSLVFELRDGPYAMIVVEVEDPSATLERFRSAPTFPAMVG